MGIFALHIFPTKSNSAAKTKVLISLHSSTADLHLFACVVVSHGTAHFIVCVVVSVSDQCFLCTLMFRL